MHTRGGRATKLLFPSEQPPCCPHQKCISPRRSTSSSAHLSLSRQISNSLSLSVYVCVCVCVCVYVCVCVSLLTDKYICRQDNHTIIKQGVLFWHCFILKIGRILCATSCQVWSALICSVQLDKVARGLRKKQDRCRNNRCRVLRASLCTATAGGADSQIGLHGGLMETGSAPRLFMAQPHPVCFSCYAHMRLFFRPFEKAIFCKTAMETLFRHLPGR